MKKKYLIIVSLIIIVLGFIIAKPYISNYLWYTADFLYPDIEEQLKKKWQNKPKKFLLKRFKSGIRIHINVVTDIFVERKELDVYDDLVKIIKKNKYVSMQIISMYVLAERGDQRIIPILLEFYNKGRNDARYLYLIEYLAKLHYEPIYTDVLKMIKDNYELADAVDLLTYFPEKKESIPILTKLHSKTTEYFFKGQIEDTIDLIKNYESR